MESTQRNNIPTNQYSINAIIFYIVINSRIASAAMSILYWLILSLYIHQILSIIVLIFKASLKHEEQKSKEDQRALKRPKTTTRQREELRKNGILRKKKGRIRRENWGLTKTILKTITITTVAFRVMESYREEPTMTEGTGGTWGNKLFQTKTQKLHNVSHDHEHLDSYPIRDANATNKNKRIRERTFDMWKRVVLFQLQVTYTFRCVIYLRSTLLKNIAKMITYPWSIIINSTVKHISHFIYTIRLKLTIWLEKYLSKYIWKWLMGIISKKHCDVWWPLLEDYEIRPKLPSRLRTNQRKRPTTITADQPSQEAATPVTPTNTNIIQLDGMADQELDSLNDTPRRNDTPSQSDDQEYGPFRTKRVQYPKGISFYCDPSKPINDIIDLRNAPLLHTPPMRPTIEESETEEDAEAQNESQQCANASYYEALNAEEIEINTNETGRTKILSINVRSAVKDERRVLIQQGVRNVDPDVVVITESWLKSSDKEFNLQGYVPIGRCDRPIPENTDEESYGRGGGVLVLAKRYIEITNVVAHPIHRDLQIVEFTVDKTTIFAIYRGPVNGKENHRTVTTWLNKAFNKLGDRPGIITGDMNLPTLANEDFEPKLIPAGARTHNGVQKETWKHMWTDFIHKHSLQQHVEGSTHINGGKLDYVFAPEYVDIPVIDLNHRDFMWSDHYGVIFEIDSIYEYSNEIQYRRKETAATWKRFKELLPTTRDIIEFMPIREDCTSDQELVDKRSVYIIEVLKRAYDEATPLTRCKPPPIRGFLSKNTIRQLTQAKKLYRVMIKCKDDHKKPKIKEKLKLINKANRWMVRKDREAWEMRRLHLSKERGTEFYRFMRELTQKTKTLGPIITQDGILKTRNNEMAEAFNEYLCNLMPPSSESNANWDNEPEPKSRQLHLNDIPNSTNMTPLEDKTLRSHIDKIHTALASHGYKLQKGDIVDGYPLGKNPRGLKSLPIVITYKTKRIREQVQDAAKNANIWDGRRRKNKPRGTIGYFTAAYKTMDYMRMTKDEIRKAIRKTKRSSAPGPDGIKMAVFAEACDTILEPLMMLYNNINDTGKIPENFKTARVIMLHKKNSQQEMGNYRPISMSNHISKLWERVFNARLMQHLDKNNRLSRHQHGFRPKRGCHTNLIETWETGIDLTDEHGPTVEIWSFDLQKAFDLLDHGKALDLCHAAGIGEFVGESLQNWLTNRTQYVQCGESKSTNRPVNRSCVQGSVLGPTLWLIYIQSLLDRLENKCQYSAYADDVTIIAQIGNKKHKKEFKRLLKILLEWGEEYGMKWGAHKTQRMSMRYPRCRAKDPPKILFDGNDIKSGDTLETLGVLLNKGGIGYAHLSKVRRKIAGIRIMVAKNYRIRTQRILEMIYTTYILPHINYCSSQWNTNVEAHLRGIDTELRRFWKLSQTRLRPSNIMGLHEQLIYNDLKQVHKIKHGKSTIKFDDIFEMSEHQKKTTEKIKRKNFKKTFAQHSFGRRIQKYWNLLTMDERDMKQDKFKAEMKDLMLNEKKAHRRQTLLNFGLARPIKLAPPGINDK